MTELIYRVILKVGYNEAWFDFNNIEVAGDFARAILTHQTKNEDSGRKDHVRLEIIDPTIEADEEEDN
jgi:hypothetical protein